MVKHAPDFEDFENEDDESDLPEGTEHLIVSRPYNGIDGASPDGYDGPDRITYEQGDEVPADMAERTFDAFRHHYIAVDGDGEVLHSPNDMEEGVAGGVVNQWERDGFKPDDYSLRYYREQGSNGGGSE